MLISKAVITQLLCLCIMVVLSVDSHSKAGRGDMLAFDFVPPPRPILLHPHFAIIQFIGSSSYLIITDVY